MSIPLPLVNLSGLVAGQTGSIQLSNLGMSANPSLTRKPATLRMHNDSGTGLLISFKLTSGAFYLPAGGWADVQIASGESEIDYQVTYVLPGAPVTTLQITYYAPNEQVPPMTQLGNSPIGVSGIVNVSTASAIDNEGNIASTQWLKVIQSGGPASNFAATVDGNFQIEQWDGTTLKNLFHTIPNAGAGNSSMDLLTAGLLARVLGQLIFPNNSAQLAFDSTAVARSLFQVDSNNNVQWFGITGKDALQLLDHTGTLRATFDLVNGILNLVGAAQSVNGDTSGTMTASEILAGPVKLVVLTQNNYRQAGAAQLITLKNAFTFLGAIFNFGCGGVVQANNNTIGNNGEVTWGTGTNAGTNATNAQVPTDAAAFSALSFNQVGSNGGYASAHTGLALYVGQ